jgi:hypothetical protein
VEGSVGVGRGVGIVVVGSDTALGASAALAAPVLVAVQLLGRALEMLRCGTALVVWAGARAERRVARIAKAVEAV